MIEPCVAVYDINLLSPAIGEKIRCDLFGNGTFQLYTLTKVTPQTFEATTEIGATGTAKVSLRFRGVRDKVDHLFWRNYPVIGHEGMLHYQYRSFQ